LIVDYHMHLRNSAEEVDHTVDAVERFVEVASDRGVDEIGFSEHMYYFVPTRPLWTQPYQTDRCVYELEPYVAAIVAAKERGLPVKLGLEVDYVPDREAETSDVLAPYPWDYLLGSIHYVDGLGIDAEPTLADRVGVARAWERYFEVLAAAAKSGLFDSLSHPDLVKIFGRRPPREIEERLHEQVADGLADHGVAVEVSSAGLRKPVGELYPDPHLLAECRARGVPITLASDAHVPQLVGDALGAAVELARAAGYDTVTVFEQRQARQEPLG
jgi:histidinol-phosphatase (PHP family)